MFMMHSLMTLTAVNQSQMHQQMDMDILYNKKRNSNRRTTEYRGNTTGYNRRCRIDNFQQPLYYQESILSEKEDVPFIHREIIDMRSNEFICFIKVNIINEKTIIINCEVKKGYMDDEEFEELIHQQILIALKNGYTNILASVGKNDEMAEDILKKMGFAIE